LPKRKLGEGFTVKYLGSIYQDNYGLLEKHGYKVGDTVDFNYMERAMVIMDSGCLVVYHRSNCIAYLWKVA
jgi:hypothetical protein